jgi:hypothetical protein
MNHQQAPNALIMQEIGKVPESTLQRLVKAKTMVEDKRIVGDIFHACFYSCPAHSGDEL